MDYPRQATSKNMAPVKSVVLRTTLRGIPTAPDSVLAVEPFISPQYLGIWLEVSAPARAPVGTRETVELYDPLRMILIVNFRM